MRASVPTYHTSWSENYAYELTGILIQGLFDKKNAREKYNDLKSNHYSDGKWIPPNPYISDKKLDYIDKFSQGHLLGILVESTFYPGAAKTDYRDLKEIFYDREKNVWETKEDKNHHAYAHEQLLSIILEQTFNQQDNFIEKPIPVPEVRIF